MDEAGPEFFEAYMSGEYDKTCDACNGTGKVKVPDFKVMSKTQREEWDSQCEADDYIRAEEEAERRFGC
jgi:RecJ-like exonuclease